MLAPDSDTVTEKRLLSWRSRRNSRTKASVSREAVRVPVAMARTLNFCDQSRESHHQPQKLRSSKSVEIEHIVAEELAGLVNNGNLASGAQAGVDSEHRDRAGGNADPATGFGDYLERSWIASASERFLNSRRNSP